MLYELRLEINGGIIFQRFFKNSLELENEPETILIMKDISEKIYNKLINNTIIKFNKLQTVPNKTGFFDLTLRIKDRIFVEEKIDCSLLPDSIRYSVNLKELIPDFIKQLKKI